ncbi:alpha-1,6-mannosylglycoprotein 6-beta-N-acetylglucosaminyltransferase A-like [Stegostoma tigrinum]|uniref:alpha-1,6-mannosylglycoprotein 6-beta-N-acetylglucosaminyltransferase A-like n=1 Tax=Stegostoma tigrinum TaxID=3053191 RepID=UPI00202B25F1|nr:alpha-1,6-mannosylglycoprotein 6-beta-N-acetylglucosaminyltransferase A-like [Stegostoma tigrinum]XP_048407312.1 alpha-1,6-mannosylglycoprotein 6-beta-N-acetylglucosaminyltransferase A-like [Stegostoma tigrinum]XP_059510723.1 alpha-1,6-mannosylglycoprotein 6-beta-N-acetylglucosaminyltransferase A-like [Stegostoma tigrinum]XP_059510726.1 alpha-1,6-mannosylglycoprotein 6-beta-N-acetylglucosaminyltransferase A-like [Stegostoma tigrinum]XP_059510733.1 alpha-1,6-mannosylglycoprotein 6-beta-N-acet
MFGSLFRRNPSQKLSVLLLIFGFIWGLVLLRYTFQHPKHQSSIELREQILELSKRYVRALAEENQNAVDGPHGASMAGYADLKKTIAVLLDDILQRLGKLENRVDDMLTNGLTNSTNNTSTNPVSAASNKQMNVQELSTLCGLTSIDGFPHCEEKIKWMQEMWKSEPCYANYGVNGTVCSFIVYLSEIENFCPMLPVRINDVANNDTLKPKAKVATSLDGLLEMLAERKELTWIKLRIERMKENWIMDMKALAKKQNLENRPKKKILLHLGLLTKESGFKIAENVFKGGPLGELVQWSDLIASIYLLGHNMMLSTSVNELKGYLSILTGNKDGCPIRGPKLLDLIYIDIVGLKQLQTVLGGSFTHYRCLLRVLDSFGTEPEFNHAEYAKKKNHGSPWGKLNLIPKQFYNMFPHTPDNSFLGFVVEQRFDSNNITLNKIPRTNKALIYGKLAGYWKDKSSFLDIVKNYAEIHGTFHNENHLLLPDFIINHGILSGHDLHLLLRETKIFVGLGFPYEGPAPLEAIANGCIFLNPKFNPPKSRKNTNFFQGKPTFRELSSQHPYAEVYIGKPHVWTVDIDNPSEVKETMRQIMEQKVDPYLPYEFTSEGMLERLNVFIEKQDFCRQREKWPPLTALRVKMAKPSQSCVEACQREQLMCEPAFFYQLNKEVELQRYEIYCNSLKTESDLFLPAFNPENNMCLFQSDYLLFSCAGSHEHYNRICPCRDYVKGQVAFCQDCLKNEAHN